MRDPLLRLLTRGGYARGGDKEEEIMAVAAEVDPIVKECMREMGVSMRDIKPTITRPRVIVTVDKETMIHCGATYWEDERVEISHDCWNIFPEEERASMVAHELAHVYSEDPEIPEEKVIEIEKCVVKKMRKKGLVVSAGR